ncbi:MAG TPA: 50S ribosomal protein L30 [Terriglobia bacterium]|nr:50S ribosomal protein L30 [Terriglobia bacterium]
MATKSSAKIKIRWIRSGIAFNRNQKAIVRSLGLRRLHQVVERADNAVVRGLVAKVSHLVEVLQETKPSVWASVPEYRVVKPEPATEVASDEKDGQPPVAEAAVETSLSEAPEPVVEPESAEPASSEAENKAPRKRQKKSARTKV